MFDKQFEKQWNNFLEEKAIALELTNCQTRVFLTRFRYDNWLKTREDIWQESDVNSFEAFVSHSTKVFRKLKPFCPKISQGAGNFSVARNYLLEELNSSSSYNSAVDFFNLERQQCDRAITEPGALIRIKAPSKMGKSRLLNNILSYANEQKYSTVHINLLQIEKSRLKNLNLFLRWFCIYISDALDLNLELDSYWSEDRGSMLSCTRYLEIVLQQLEQPLVIGLDEADRLLNYPDISQDFFYLLRSWHEEANNDELWEQLRLIVVYSTEDFGSLDINQSPFNVGLPIEIQPFNRQQIEQLAQSYQLNFGDREINELIKMLGGHPYLVDIAMSYLIANPQENLSSLLEEAATDTGIYDSYLRQYLINLKSNSKLREVFIQILNSLQPIQVDTILGYQLYRMGLIKRTKNNAVTVSCELFKLYFLPRL